MCSTTDLPTYNVGDRDGAGHIEDTGEAPADHIEPDSEQAAAEDVSEPESQPASATRRVKWKPVVAHGLLPALALIMVVAAGYLKYLDASSHDSEMARSQSVQTATEGTIAMLSYRPDTAEKDLTAAQDRLTGGFRDSYARLTHDVVIPGAKQKQISAIATAPAAASVSADRKHAVVFIFVNQKITVGNDAPTNTSSTVRVTLDNVDRRWLAPEHSR
jgi:Mce-associated membrane protein